MAKTVFYLSENREISSDNEERIDYLITTDTGYPALELTPAELDTLTQLLTTFSNRKGGNDHE